MNEINRWKCCLGRHIKSLASFSGQRSVDRRLSLLREAGYIDRKRILYGIPAIYTLTYKAKKMLGLSLRQDKIKIEQIQHDIYVIDTAIYFMYKENIPLKSIRTEKELHSIDGFSNRKHKPDFIFTKDNETFCVEVELNLKAKNRFEKNIKDNFMNYDYQNWVIPDSKIKIKQILSDNLIVYPNIEILSLEEVLNYVNNL